jgi:hypothetical protein
MTQPTTPQPTTPQPTTPQPTTLHPIADDLWGAEHDLFMPGGVHFRGRMCVVRLPDGGLVLHSPVPIDDALAAELAVLGPVTHLIAPNKLHYLHLAAAHQRYPDAKVWAAPGLGEKQPELVQDGVIDAVIGSERAPWESVLEPVFVEGIPWVNEVVFRHGPSRTLILTDLFFHIHQVANWQSRFLFWMLGVLGKAKQSPLVRRQTKDRAAAGASLRRVVAWDLDRAVPAHGRLVEGDVTASLERIFAWHLEAAPVLLTAAAAG